MISSEIRGGGDRDNSLDLLRIISTVAVTLIHANWHYFSQVYESPDGSFEWTVMSLINILTRFSVPCFVMISGAFILSNTGNGNAKMFYKKTSYRIFLPAIVSTIVMIIPVVVYDAIIGDSVIHDLTAIPKGTAFNMWYIWMLVGLYALTPIVILIKRNLSFKQYASCSFIMLIWAVVSQAFSQQQLPYSIGVVIAYVSYFTIGDVIKTRIGVIGVSHQKRNVVTCIVFGFCAVLAAYYCRKAGYNYYISDAYTNFFSPAIVIYSIAVFCFFCLINVKCSLRSSAVAVPFLNGRFPTQNGRSFFNQVT